MPDTGGANIPALNDLLSSWNIVLGDGVYEGDYSLAKQIITYGSGTHIVKFPSNGVTLAAFLFNEGIYYHHDNMKSLICRMNN